MLFTDNFFEKKNEAAITNVFKVSKVFLSVMILFFENIVIRYVEITGLLHFCKDDW